MNELPSCSSDMGGGDIEMSRCRRIVKGLCKKNIPVATKLIVLRIIDKN